MLGMYISCCLFPVASCWVANANAISGGIWAYVFSKSVIRIACGF